jgi:hypothetical protein
MNYLNISIVPLLTISTGWIKIIFEGRIYKTSTVTLRKKNITHKKLPSGRVMHYHLKLRDV